MNMLLKIRYSKDKTTENLRKKVRYISNVLFLALSMYRLRMRINMDLWIMDLWIIMYED